MFSIIQLLVLWLRTYFGAQRKTDLSRAIVIETPLDERIGVEEHAIYPYLFACLYVMYVAWYILSKLSPDEYRRAFKAYDTAIREAERQFLDRPTRMKDRSRTRHPLTLFTHTIDGPTNCYPSLHVTLVVLSYQIIKDGPTLDELSLSAMRKSCIDICRSTMQIKQHSIIDVIGGYALAERICRVKYDAPFEDLLHDILPELGSESLADARVAIVESQTLSELLDRLLARFTS